MLLAAVAMASPDVEVRKSVNVAMPVTNEPVEFTIEVRNIGAETAFDVLIVDQLPVEMNIPAGMAAFPSIGSYDAASGEWIIGELIPGAGGTLVIPAIVIDSQPPQCLVNSAKSVPGDIHSQNNEMRAAIYQGTGYRCVDLRSFPNIFAGESVFPTCDSQQPYQRTVDVGNFGPDAARNVVVSLTQTPIIGASIRFDDPQCEILGLDVCTVAVVPVEQIVSLNVTSDIFQNYADIDHRLSVSVSTTDVDYVSENDFVEATLTVRGFSSCESIEPNISAGPGNSGCFIATAAYGSALDPHLDSLRNFRDRFLETNRPGRAMVRFYYRHSPPLADFIAERDWLRTVVRGLLTPVVLTLKYPISAALVIIGLVAAFVVRRRRGMNSATLYNGD